MAQSNSECISSVKLSLRQLCILFALTGCAATKPHDTSLETASVTSQASSGISGESVFPVEYSLAAIKGETEKDYASKGTGIEAVDTWSVWTRDNGEELSLAYTFHPLGIPLPNREVRDAYNSFAKGTSVLDTGQSSAWDGNISWILSKGSRSYCLSFVWHPASNELYANLGGAYCRDDTNRPTAQKLIDALDMSIYMQIGKGRYANYRDRLAARISLAPTVRVPADLQDEINACTVDSLMKTYSAVELDFLDAFSRGDIRVSYREMDELNKLVSARIFSQGGPLASYRQTCPETLAKILAPL